VITSAGSKSTFLMGIVTEVSWAAKRRLASMGSA
jgi:hypothetical protein